MKKNLFILILLFIVHCSMFAAFDVSALNIPKEIDYPNLPLAPAPGPETTLPEYVRYLFYFAIAISGFLALGSLIWAGFTRITSTGIPEKINEANDRIKSALLGLVILFGSVLILVTINPNIIRFQLPTLDPSVPTISHGIYLCNAGPSVVDIRSIWDAINKANAIENDIEAKKEMINDIKEAIDKMSEHCLLVSSSSRTLPLGFEDKIQFTYVVPSKTHRYGAILYKERGYEDPGSDENGQQVIYKLEFEPAAYRVALDVSSIKTFRIENEVNTNYNVKVYENKDLEEKAPGPTEPATNPHTYWVNNIVNCGVLTPPYGPFQISPPFIYPPPSNPEVHQFQSVDIEGSLIVIFFRNRDCGGEWTGTTKLYVLLDDDRDLNNNRPIGKWCNSTSYAAEIEAMGYEDPHSDFPCGTSMVYLIGGIY